MAGALTFGSGALDVLALTKLGGVSASVMTGNLALLGLGLARADDAGIVPVVVAVVAHAVGVGAHGAHWWLLQPGRADLTAAALAACLIAGVLLVPIAHHLRISFAAIGFASVVALIPGVYVFRMLSGVVQFASSPTTELRWRPTARWRHSSWPPWRSDWRCRCTPTRHSTATAE